MIGKLNMYVEPGTVMGPNTTGELVTAYMLLPRAEGYEGPDATTFRHAQTKDFGNIIEPRSVTEHAMIAPVRSPFGMIRTLDPYEMPTPKAMPAKLITEKRLIKEAARLLIGEGQNG